MALNRRGPRGWTRGAGDFAPVTDNEAEMFAATSYVPRKSSRNGALVFSVAVFLAGAAAALTAGVLVEGRISLTGILAALALGLLAASSLHIALGWEKVVVLRLGKLHRVVGPGFYGTIPILEYGTIRVDQRTIATPFRAERTLTADLVPVNIDAVLFWVVWDAEKACVEVEDYYAAISYLAQTSLREAVGRSTVAEVALRRDQLDVKVRYIVIPPDLQNVMSLEAQADRERNARMTVASAEADLAEMLTEAAQVYGDPEAALKLRTMLMQYETVKESGSAVVTVPTAVSDGFAEGVCRESARV